jgi:hypothetical protein
MPAATKVAERPTPAGTGLVLDVLSAGVDIESAQVNLASAGSPELPWTFLYNYGSFNTNRVRFEPELGANDVDGW